MSDVQINLTGAEAWPNSLIQWNPVNPVNNGQQKIVCIDGVAVFKGFL